MTGIARGENDSFARYCRYSDGFAIPILKSTVPFENSVRRDYVRYHSNLRFRDKHLK